MSETENIVDPTPNLPTAIPYEANLDTGIKSATPDLIIFDDTALPVDNLSSLIFENLGAQESINILRNDTIDGANIDYSIVSNLKNISAAYNSKNILNVPGTLEQYFKNFSIRLETHIPERGTGPNGNIIYIDRDSQNPLQQDRLVIDVVGMKTNEQVEIQILNSGIYLDDIMESTEES